MNDLKSYEIRTLKHLSDGKQHKDVPAGITDALYYAALKKLNEKDMVHAVFVSGGKVFCAQIKTLGQAALDEMRLTEKRVLRKILKEKDITPDQYDLLQYIIKNGEGANIFGVDFDYFKKEIAGPLSTANYIKLNKERVMFNLTRKGTQLVEEIEEELDFKLAEEQKEEEIVKAQLQVENANNQSESHVVKDGGIRISEDRITDVIKSVWSMHDIGMFVDQNGNQPTVKSVMDAFGEFLQAKKQFEQYSSYMNSSLQTGSKNTYLQVFYDLGESAENHYKEKKNRKINK